MTVSEGAAEYREKLAEVFSRGLKGNLSQTIGMMTKGSWLESLNDAMEELNREQQYSKWSELALSKDFEGVGAFFDE